jgi:hypothetical protein
VVYFSVGLFGLLFRRFGVNCLVKLIFTKVTSSYQADHAEFNGVSQIVFPPGDTAITVDPFESSFLRGLVRVASHEQPQVAVVRQEFFLPSKFFISINLKSCWWNVAFSRNECVFTEMLKIIVWMGSV